MADKPSDRFEEYFTEKIWEMIPSVYRYEDAIAEKPGVLRALVEILAEQAAILRRSHDRLWEDQFIELCDNWAVPYLGDLLGTRLVSALNERAYRIDVAKTIYYRRRKGTLRVQEELISDIAGWEGKVVENFRRLARTRHRLDPKPLPLAGRLTGTLPGGWADLRHPRTSELVGSPFDEFHYTPDIRHHHGQDGRYGIPKLAFHLYRLYAFRVSGVSPDSFGQNRYTFDPSGRDIPLFMPRNRSQDPYPDPKAEKEKHIANWDAWRSAREWELPAPMHCQVLGDEQGKTKLIPAGLQVEELPGVPIPPGQSVPVPSDRIVAANLDSWLAAFPPGTQLAIDPEQGRFQFPASSPGSAAIAYCYGFSGEIGAGTYDRRAVERRTEIEKPPESIEQREITQSIPRGGGSVPVPNIQGTVHLDDSATYSPISNATIKQLTFQAANQERPYVQLADNWVLDAQKQDADLVLDGIWFGSKDKFNIILKGDYERVIIRSCTLDPGGTKMDRTPIHPVSLVIEAKVENLIIESSILGPIYTQSDGTVENLSIQDSIVQSMTTKIDALKLPQGKVNLKRVTIFGTVKVNRLRASEALITGKVDVTDTQDGCFRFSAAPFHINSTNSWESRLPHPYEHFEFEIDDAQPYFNSQRFGDPGYGQLSQLAPIELQQGAENGSEIGAFSYLKNPIRLESLQTKVNEYLPFGLIPIFISET